MNALSVGFPGLLKSSFTPLEYAHRSKLLEMNSGPLSTRIVRGLPRREATPSKTRTTSSPINRHATSSPINRHATVIGNLTKHAYFIEKADQAYAPRKKLRH